MWEMNDLFLKCSEIVHRNILNKLSWFDYLVSIGCLKQDINIESILI